MSVIFSIDPLDKLYGAIRNTAGGARMPVNLCTEQWPNGEGLADQEPSDLGTAATRPGGWPAGRGSSWNSP